MSSQPATDEQIARDIITMGMDLLVEASTKNEPGINAYPRDLTAHDLRECTAMLRASRALLVLEADQLRRALATTHHRIRTLFYPLLLKPIPTLYADELDEVESPRCYVSDGRGGELEVTEHGTAPGDGC